MLWTIVSCLIIIAGAVGIWLRLRKKTKDFKEILEEIDKVTVVESIRGPSVTTYQYNNDSRLEKKTKSGEEKIESYDLEKLNNTKEDFFRHYAEYVSASQLIPLFPLLGILGTVFGLMLGLRQQDMAVAVNQLVSGLGVALSTTFAGLIVTVGLKIIDAYGPGKLVNQIEGQLTVIDSKIQIQTLKEELQSAKNAIHEQTDSSQY